MRSYKYISSLSFHFAAQEKHRARTFGRGTVRRGTVRRKKNASFGYTMLS